MTKSGKELIPSFTPVKEDIRPLWSFMRVSIKNLHKICEVSTFVYISLGTLTGWRL
jgi:hypothetical protein